MAKTGMRAAIYAGFLLLPLAADAVPIITARCTADSLDSAQAEARLMWARRCALTTHVVYPSLGYGIGVQSVNGTGELIEYQEGTDTFWGKNMYSSTDDALEVNSTVMNRLYLSGGTYQGTDVNGFKQWWKEASRKKARPLYPIFGSTSSIDSTSNQQLFVNPNNPNDCNLYTNKEGTVRWYGDFYVNAYCEASCYTPEQRVLFSDGYDTILDALNERREDVVTLTSNSTIDNIQLQTGETYAYTAEVRDANHPIVEIRTASGGLLRVTTEHPVVEGSGRLVHAQTLKAGDELLKADGSRDEIVEVNRTHYFGKVYNLRPTGTNRVSHILVAEDYLVGSSLFQNDEVDYINRRILFKQVPSELIP